MTNNRQLSHTINKNYGNNFDGHRYLNRFFDLVLQLPKYSPDKYLQEQLNIPNDHFFVNMSILSIAKHLELTLRETERFRLSWQVLKNGDRRHSSMPWQLTHYLFAPMALALRLTSVKEFDQFMRGHSSNLVKDYMENYPYLLRVVPAYQGDANSEEALNKIVEIYEQVVSEMDANEAEILNAQRVLRDYLESISITTGIK